MKKNHQTSAYPEVYALHVINIFYTSCVGPGNKKARSIPQLPLTVEVKPEISGDHSFSVIDSKQTNQDGQKTS